MFEKFAYQENVINALMQQNSTLSWNIGAV